MKEILKGKDCQGETLEKGDSVFAEDGRVQGKVETLYDDGSVDIHHSNAHQGPVIDSFDIMGKDVTKLVEG